MLPDGLKRLYELPTKHPIIASALVAALTFVFKAWIEKFVHHFFRPFGWLGTRLYFWVAPRNPLSISIYKYKKHLSRSNLAFLENPVGPSLRVPLESSFAPLKLISSDQKCEIDFFSYTADSKRFVLLGGPGTGKTTLMKSLVQNIIHRRCISQPALNSLTPVFIVLRNLASKGHSVEQAVIASFADHYFPGADKYVASALEEGKLVIILDGLDEVGPNRPFVIQQIQDFCMRDDQRKLTNKIIVTCREASYRLKVLRDFIPEELKVEPFGNDHMRIFLQGWPAHRGKHALSLFTQIQNDTQIKDVCRNPLLLTILTGLFLDTDKFELPTSRDSFYHAAIEELMLQRPSRRNIQQQFANDKKRRMLESIALERIENSSSSEDPEEFSSEFLQKSAESFLDEKADFESLLAELIEINGILKQGGEDSYTFPHRTIQEYLAARECSRSRETPKLLAEASQRHELLEVLFFYCGIIKNIPQLNSILEMLIADSRWLEAAKALVNMTESPAPLFIQRINDGLLAGIKAQQDAEAGLMLLSSLSGKQSSVFDSTRRILTEAIDLLMQTGNKGATSALESALATSPELAMKIVPALLASTSVERRHSALVLLRDIGTDQALYQLVELLAHNNLSLKAEAAAVLAGIIDTRLEKIKACSVLLNERNKKPLIWPLENYLPSAIALPMIEALTDVVTISNPAIACGVEASRIFEMREPPQAAFDLDVRKYWPRIIRDMRLNKIFNEISILASFFAVLASFHFLFLISKFSLHGWNLVSMILLFSQFLAYFAIMVRRWSKDFRTYTRRDAERRLRNIFNTWALFLPGSVLIGELTLIIMKIIMNGRLVILHPITLFLLLGLLLVATVLPRFKPQNPLMERIDYTASRTEDVFLIRYIEIVAKRVTMANLEP